MMHGTGASPPPRQRTRQQQPVSPQTPKAARDESGAAETKDSQLHMLTDSDIVSLLKWGRLTIAGSRSERLQRLRHALAEHRTVSSPTDGTSPRQSSDTTAWLVNPLSGWKFPLTAVRAAPGIPVTLGRKSSAASSDMSGACLPESIGLPSDSKTISRRHAEVCFGLPRASATENERGPFHLRSLQGGKKAVLHNGRKLLPSADDGDTWVKLKDGDRIIVGPCLLHVRMLDGDSGATLGTAAPSNEAIGAAIRALTPLERSLLLSRDPSLRQYDADKNVRAWLDSSEFAATTFAGGAGPQGDIDRHEVNATHNLHDQAGVDDDDNLESVSAVLAPRSPPGARESVSAVLAPRSPPGARLPATMALGAPPSTAAPRPIDSTTNSFQRPHESVSRDDVPFASGTPRGIYDAVYAQQADVAAAINSAAKAMTNASVAVNAMPRLSLLSTDPGEQILTSSGDSTGGTTAVLTFDNGADFDVDASIFRPDAADVTRELTSWEKEQQQQAQQEQAQQEQAQQEQAQQQQSPPSPPLPPKQQQQSPQLPSNQPNEALQSVPDQAQTRAKTKTKHTRLYSGHGEPTQMDRTVGRAEILAPQSMRSGLQREARKETAGPEQSARGAVLEDIYRGTGLLSPGSMGPSSPAERSAIEDSVQHLQQPDEADGTAVRLASSPVRVRLTMDDLSSPLSPPSHQHQYQHHPNHRERSNMQQRQQQEAVQNSAAAAVVGNRRDVAIVSCCEDAHIQADEVDTLKIRLLRSGDAVAQATGTEHARLRQQLEQYVEQNICGRFVRDVADSDGGGAVGSPDVSHLYRQNIFTDTVDPEVTNGELGGRESLPSQRQPLSWPQYKHRHGDAMLRFVLAPAVVDGQPSSLLGWWCLAANRAEATEADCLAKFAVTADSEHGCVPTDPSALSRWEINRGSTTQHRAHNSDLRLVISENRRRNAASTGAVARLAAKYKPQTSEASATLAQREQRAGSVGDASTVSNHWSHTATHAEARREEMARLRAARAAAGSPRAVAVQHRSRSGSTTSRSATNSPERRNTIPRGARDSTLELQRDFTDSLGNAGRARTRSQSRSPPTRPRPQSSSRTAVSPARRPTHNASQIRWKSRHSAAETAAKIQDSYARDSAKLAEASGVDRDGWVHREHSEHRGRRPERVTLRLKPSGSRARGTGRAHGTGRGQ